MATWEEGEMISPRSNRFVSAKVSSPSQGGRRELIGSSVALDSDSVEAARREGISRQELIQQRLKEAESTQEIILDGLDIKSMPNGVCTFAHNLTKLYLHNNQMVVLPPEIGCLVHLTSLSVESNKLRSLPREIGQLVALERLHLHGNFIVSLPSEIGKLENLRRLFLSDNCITSLPPEIGSLMNLQWLSLDHNKLTSLPMEIGCLTKLGWFSLESNDISALPLTMGSLYSLDFLSLVDNPIADIPKSLIQLTQLKDVRIDKRLNIPQDVLNNRNGRDILKFLTDVIARWDLELEERGHWVPDDSSTKCQFPKCGSLFSFTKRRHHCRLCGLLFCNKHCDQVCEVPGMNTAGRVCPTCYDIIDPQHPSNLYMQHCAKMAEEQAQKVYGLAEGDEHLPLMERTNKILAQVEEIDASLLRIRNVQDGLNRIIGVYQASGDGEQTQMTLGEIDKNNKQIQELEATRVQLTELLRQFENEKEG